MDSQSIERLRIRELVGEMFRMLENSTEENEKNVTEQVRKLMREEHRRQSTQNWSVKLAGILSLFVSGAIFVLFLQAHNDIARAIFCVTWVVLGMLGGYATEHEG